MENGKRQGERDRQRTDLAAGDGKLGPLPPGQGWTVARKREAMLRLLRGESAELLLRELGVESYRPEQWRDQDSWLRLAEKHGACTEERPGKAVYVGEVASNRGLNQPPRVVFTVTKRTIDATGQLPSLPELEVDTCWTSLPDAPAVVIRQYQDHGTSEQFHRELISELNLERPPAGKFATNHLVRHLGLAAYHLLRFIGQESLQVAEAPLRKKVQRRRIRTVLQNLITLASRLVYHARHYQLSFSQPCPWVLTFRRIYGSLAAG